MRPGAWRRRGAVAVAAALTALVLADGRPRGQTADAFASRIARLSEAGGYFDTDNLISNERHYLHVLPELRALGVTGGAYLGVGPDQNFSYIAHIRPDIAFLVDVRRDNLLLHLLFKALFTVADTRVEYLSLLLGRAPPDDPASWRDADVDALIAHVEQAPREDAHAARLDAALSGFAVPLSPGDLRTIRRFHQTFAANGVSLKFTSHNRPPRPIYPTYRELIAAEDPDGRPASFLATEELFLVVRALQRRDLVIPVVGDLAGPTAVGAIGRLLETRGTRVSAFYVSNVEQYLSGNGTFGRYLANLAALPRAPHAALIRTAFQYSDSVSSVQPMAELLEGHAARPRAPAGRR